jgi:hypothetical protein
LNLAAKVQFFYTHYGLRRTMVRVLERLTGLDILRLPRRSLSDGLGTMIVGSSDTRSAPTSVRLSPGMAVAQDLGLLFDELLEIDLRLELSPSFERGDVLLFGTRSEVFRQPIDSQRASGGRYSIFFDKPLSVSGAGRLQLLICNRGQGDARYEARWPTRLAHRRPQQLPACQLPPAPGSKVVV